MKLEIHFLDVGQGDCTVLLFKKDGGEVIRSVVIDCGGTNAFGSGENEDLKDEQQAGLKLLSFYKKHDIRSFDIWIITHWDKDHFGGFNYILKEAKENKGVRKMINTLSIYDRGECFNYGEGIGFTSGDMKNQKTPYVSFRQLLSEVKKEGKKNDKDMDLERPTERIYGNKDYDRKKFKLNKKNPKAFRFISSKPDDEEYYLFRAPHYLLGEDLLNRDFEDPIDHARLECLVVNGWYRKKNTLVQVNDKNRQTDIENWRSMGLLLTFGEFSCWFGGDLESEIEDTLIPVIKARIGDRPLSLSKASHHGSHHSTSSYFIDELQPDTLIVSSPPESTKHPHPDFLKRIAENKTIQAVYLTGCRPYIGEDQKSDGYSGSVIEGIKTKKLLGLSGDLIAPSSPRKFYVCGGTEHSTNDTFSGDICVSTSGNRTKEINYWEAFCELVLNDTNSKDILENEIDTVDIESVVDDFGNLYEGIEVDHDDTGSKSIRMTKPLVLKKKSSKKRKREVLYDINGSDMFMTFRQKRRRLE